MFHRNSFKQVILDVDGVIWKSGSPTPGAAELLQEFETEDLQFCLLTNDCSISKADRYAILMHSGFAFEYEKLVMVAEVTRNWLLESSLRLIMYLGVPEVVADLAEGLEIREQGPVDAVVIGDLFKSYKRNLLDEAAKAIITGAQLIAMQKNAYWSDGDKWYVDNGFWVAGVEYVTGRQAVILGKPSKNAYLTALQRLGLKEPVHKSAVFVSDDINSDLKGAKALGLKTIYLGTECEIPAWVDYRVDDLISLRELLIG